MLDPSIILAGRSPDIMGQMARGTQTAAMQNAVQKDNRLAQLYATQGAGIMGGDQNALAALAGLDPMAALGVQESRLGMDATRQGMALNAAQLEKIRQSTRFEVEDRIKSQGMEAALAEAQQTQRMVQAALLAKTPEELTAFISQNAPELVGVVTMENRDMLAASLMDGVSDALEMAQGDDPKPGNDYERYVARERAAGREPLDEFGYRRAVEATKGDGMTFRQTLSDGSVIEFGEKGIPKNDTVSVGDVYNPAGVDDAIALIDDIAQSPSLSRVTGTIEGGGGNDVEQLSTTKRAWYGSEGVSTVEKIGQLQSKSWLAARAMLKGGGPITDYESRKAEGAVARLSRAKGEKEFRAALQDLRDAITDGMAKLQDANAGGGSGSPTATPETPGLTSPEVPGAKTEAALDDIERLLEKYGQ